MIIIINIYIALFFEITKKRIYRHSETLDPVKMKPNYDRLMIIVTNI